MNNAPTKIISLQFALFFRNNIERPDTEFKNINEEMMNIFDGIPTILPIPKELPPEIPRVTQRSSSNEYTCNIAKSRIDLLFQRINNEKSNATILNDFNAKVISFINYVLKKQKIERFGIISRYFHEDLEDIKTIKNKYFKNSIGDISDGDITELSLRYNKKEKTPDWEINNVIEIVSGIAVTDGKDTKGIIIQCDINNNPKPNKNIDIESLKMILQKYEEQLTEKSIEALFI